MRRAIACRRHGSFDPALAPDSVTLDHQARRRRRVMLQSDGGAEILLDLEKPAGLGDGDALVLEDGALLLVKAAAEALLEIRTEDPAALIRIAWHIGNRHTPAELTREAIYIVEDHVLASMVEGLGGRIVRVTRRFQPEAGAYAGHGHD
jgi:urease accessory protein